MDFEKIVGCGVDLFASEQDQWQTLVNTVVNL